MSKKDFKYIRQNKLNIDQQSPVIFVNNMSYLHYFKNNSFFYNKLLFFFNTLNLQNLSIKFSICVKGGGLSAQNRVIIGLIAKMIDVKFPDLHSELKSNHFLTLDSRRKESKKVGLKRARKRRQFTKR